MRRIHRLAGLLSALSLVASVLVTSGFVCQLPGQAAQMTAMAMGDVPTQPPSATDVMSPVKEAPATPSAPCRLPWAPSGCHSMAPCAPAAVAAERVVIFETSRVIRNVASAAILAPASETKAPELPPPRA